MRFRDHEVVVTGAGRGIGRAAVARFLAEGARVAAIDVEPPAGEGDTERLSWHAFDITDAGAVVDFFARRSRCDVLVNNAGIPGEGALAELTVAHWNRVFAVNVTAQMLMAKAALPLLSAGASIVNLASVAAHLGFAERAAYCASKSAVLGLTRSLAVELAGRVRVNCLCPGTVDTPWIARLAGDGVDREERMTAMAERQVIGRLGRPDEIAAAIAFLASHEASFITGAVIMADGGMTIAPR
ncbi:SDR family oxidoreductase [Bosea vestrisii]|uniref:SDR family NAD(P)-dependent oxidoreductase n=1 Tax=Bosea vestrisii TaxID=151416 RepID=UPI0024DFCE4F|nr:SDR family oxidoreductase [Bosea vestrisii]WID95123.1 SDR family oxidoreductase [Bosea vestrisii]